MQEPPEWRFEGVQRRPTRRGRRPSRWGIELPRWGYAGSEKEGV